jgi:tape measure domain-containing protein
VSDILRSLGIEIDLSGDADNELRDWIKSLHEARGKADSFAGSMTNLEREMIESAKKIGLSEEHLKDLINETRRSHEVQRFAEQYGFAMGSVERRTREAANQLNSFGAVINGVLATGALSRLFDGARDMIDVAARYEQTAVSFEVMLGSAERAKDVLRQITEFSNATPFTPEQVTSASRSLLAMGVQAENLTATLRQVGDVASGVGMSFNELAEIYGKNLASGKVDMEDIRQLAGRGIPIMKELSKVFFGNENQVAQVRELSSQGRITFQHLQQAFENMTSAGGVYFNMMERQSRTALGLWSTFEGNVGEVKRKLGMMILEGLKPLLNLLVQFTGWLQGNETAMKALKVAVLIIVPIVGVMLAGAVINAVKALNIFQWATVKAMLPYIALAGLILAVVLAIEDLYTWMKGGDSVIMPWLEQHRAIMTVLKILAPIIGVLLVAMIIKATIAFGSMAIAVLAATWPILAIIAAIGLIIAIIYDLYKAFTGGNSVILNFVKSAWEAISSFFSWIWEGITSFISNAAEALISFGAKVIDIIIWPFKAAYNGIRNALGAVWDFLFGSQGAQREIIVSGAIRQQAAGARASGGPVSAGMTYLVGEKGPELFIPNRDGYVLPNVPNTASMVSSESSKSSGGLIFAPVITINGPSTREDGEYLANIVRRTLEEFAKNIEGGVRAGLGLGVR